MSAAVQQAYLNACLAELEALKPGNVHIFADGHGMRVQDFIYSAEASAPALCDDQVFGTRTLGQRILHALQATHAKVGCNTNLGIILLAAPVVQACLQYPQLSLSAGLQQVLQQTTVDDAASVYEGIRLVSPAGMGQRDEHDVSQAPQITLLQAMQLASANDMVARQYADGYASIFTAAIPLYTDCYQRWQRPAWALTAVYLYWLASVPDSHIARKYGQARAVEVQQTASAHYQAFVALGNPKHYMPDLLKWDQALKQEKINPGTSADLTVITAMLSLLDESRA
ncbi:triphosphoribosyl-dephospho-CoA synthase [Methylophilus sp. UBA6697]|uniref:triphosphoribosyl-dephospho-CoA synthase n=1 Tax=Methylophilus sp. UBA6697 TaxID=1946902 RepID=UPI000EEF2064|nr:triphosphoribosyl-dephospho-CoA synthase [Methylophilus sp. UBA6697]HCU85165.1 triphosphoribosyl-dephospho-CoA synthase [Methylophilus sp.]